MYQPERTLIDVCYRKNVREYLEWEEAERKRQDEAVRAFIARERRPWRVPRWLRILVYSVAGFILAWAFIVLMFSF